MPKQLFSGFVKIGLILIVIVLISGASLFILQQKKIIPQPKSEIITVNVQTSPLPILTTSPLLTPSLKPSISAMPSPTPQPSPTPKLSPTPTPTPKAVSEPPGSGYSRITVATERGNFTISVVSIDMNGVRMITDTASDNDCNNDCPTIPLADYISHNGGFAAINGSYFCPTDYADCENKKNSFDFPVYNSRLNKWINQGNLFWNDRAMIYQDGSGMHFLRNANSFGGGLSAGITNYPGLLDEGEVIVDSYPLSEKQKSKGTKTGIGIRGNVVYMIVAGSVDIYDLAHIFKSLGARSALNLDGGGSAALWYNGYKSGPGRNLPNAIIFAR